MALIIARERVRDYDTFLRVFASGHAWRAAGGVLEEAVYRAEDEAATVAIVLRFASLAAAHAFSASARLREVLAEAGVEAASRRVECYDAVATERG